MKTQQEETLLDLDPAMLRLQSLYRKIQEADKSVVTNYGPSPPYEEMGIKLKAYSHISRTATFIRLRDGQHEFFNVRSPMFDTLLFRFSSYKG